MNGKPPIGAMIAVVVAYVTTLMLRNDEPVIARSSYSQEPLEQPEQPKRTHSEVAPEHERVVRVEDVGDVALLAHVEHKYRFLIADADKQHVVELRQRLLERESQASLAERERLEAQISLLLSADGVAYFEALKDSDLEQHHLAEYTGGISNIAPLDPRQERVVLDAKLRQKQRYETVMRDLGFDRDALSPAEREYAHKRTAEALKRYLDDFLSDVAPALTLEQYTQLKNYETTEFDRQLARLQQKINAK